MVPTQLSLNDILFTKVRDVRSPKRANQHDAGIDFFLPTLTSTFMEDFFEKNPHYGTIREKWAALFGEDGKDCFIKIPAFNRVLIPSGIKVWIQNKQSALVAFNKSGLAANKGLTVTAQVVDADYTGEVHIGLQNNSEKEVIFKEGDKIGQFLHLDLYLSQMVEISHDDYIEISSNSDRGEGGFGSTDKK